MKNKIRLRLLVYFAGSFLLFSLMIGVLFYVLFSLHNMNIHKDELGARAAAIAETLSGFYNEPTGMSHGHGMMSRSMSGHGMVYASYISFLDNVAIGDVWIVDSNMENIMRGHGMADLNYRDLPEGAEHVIAQSLEGSAVFSSDFGTFLGTPAVTAAAPIVLDNGTVGGSVLLHKQLTDISSTTFSGLIILLFSMLASVIISVFVAGALAGRFTKPLEKMRAAAQAISGGDFTARTGVSQDDEIGQLATALDDMAARLCTAAAESAKLETLRRDFIANISHELRTPVTVIRGSLEALRDGVVSDAPLVDEYHRQMLAESVYLERLVNDLLDLARLQNPDFAIDAQAFDLRAAAEDAIRSMNRIAQGKNVTLRLNCESQGLTIAGDYGRIRQLFIILLDNAIKFSLDGGYVDISLTGSDTAVIASVRDTACGISPDDLPYIFERFHKQRSEQNKDGTGLGLAIASKIAERHSAGVAVRSKIGAGTEFVFTFPQFVER